MVIRTGLSFIDVIIMLGAVQGIILSSICFVKKGHKSLRFLAFFILALSIQLILLSQFGLNLLKNYYLIIILLDGIPLILSPLLYFYIYHIFYMEYIPKRPFVTHLIPYFINILVLIFVLFIIGVDGFKTHLLETLSGNPPVYITILLVFKLMSGIFYSISILIIIKRFKTELKEWRSNKRKRYWITTITASFILAWIIIVVLGIISSTTPISEFKISVYTIIQTSIFVFIIYITVSFTLRYPVLFEYRKVRDKIRERLNVTDSEIEKLNKLLDDKMNKDMLYTNPELSLKSLSEQMGIHPNLLSYLINETYKKNISTYINTLRVNDFILNANDKQNNETYLTLAFNAGFNSKATFNRIFKELIGTTPSNYLKK